MSRFSKGTKGYNSNHHHKHPGLGHLARSVSRVTLALSNVSSVSQLFSFLVGCSGMILKGFGLVTFFAGVKASCFCIRNNNNNNNNTCIKCILWRDLQHKLYVLETYIFGIWPFVISQFNPLNPELNPICYLLALLGAHHFLHVSRIRVKLLTFRLLMSYIYGAPILDVSRSHTTTQHSR